MAEKRAKIVYFWLLSGFLCSGATEFYQKDGDGTMETIKQMIRSKLRFPEQLLRIADKYDVSVLKETIELALIPLIEASNVTFLWIASDMCNSLPLKKAVVTFLVQNWKENDKF